MNKTEKLIKVQDIYLEDLRKSRKNVEVNLINGIILNCEVLNVDNFAILVELNNKKSLIYKHSIAFIK